LEALSGSSITAEDPFPGFVNRQPSARFDAFLHSEIDRMAKELSL
jgi:hypothetical protein